MKHENKKGALITGGATRIGRSLALHFAKQEYHILLHYNASKNEAQKVKEEIESLGGKCTLLQKNLKPTQGSTDLIKEAFSIEKEIHLLINNASLFERASFLETSQELLNEQFQIHFFSPFVLIQEYAKKMNSGHIINLLDTKVKANQDSYFAYTLSKKSLLNLTKMAAAELAPNIRVNAIAPGFILPPKDLAMDHKKYIEKKIPLKRQGQVTEIIGAAQFLEVNTFITGQVLYIDGGQHLKN